MVYGRPVSMPLSLARWIPNVSVKIISEESNVRFNMENDDKRRRKMCSCGLLEIAASPPARYRKEARLIKLKKESF